MGTPKSAWQLFLNNCTAVSAIWGLACIQRQSKHDYSHEALSKRDQAIL